VHTDGPAFSRDCQTPEKKDGPRGGDERGRKVRKKPLAGGGGGVPAKNKKTNQRGNQQKLGTFEENFSRTPGCSKKKKGEPRVIA